jgi:hypothetical protein
MNTITDEDGCTLTAEVDDSAPIPTIRVNANSPWDTWIAIDLTPEQARDFAATLLRVADDA